MSKYPYIQFTDKYIFKIQVWTFLAVAEATQQNVFQYNNVFYNGIHLHCCGKHKSVTS